MHTVPAKNFRDSSPVEHYTPLKLTVRELWYAKPGQQSLWPRRTRLQLLQNIEPVLIDPKLRSPAPVSHNSFGQKVERMTHNLIVWAMLNVDHFFSVPVRPALSKLNSTKSFPNTWCPCAPSETVHGIYAQNASGIRTSDIWR